MAWNQSLFAARQAWGRKTFLPLVVASALALGVAASHAQPASGAITAVSAPAGNAGGLNVQVKGIGLQDAHTVLQVAVSFANQRRPDGAKLAHRESFLLTDAGERLMLKRPDTEPTLPIANNATMEGELTFIGALPIGTKAVTLVLNADGSPTHSQGPTLNVPVELPAQLQSQLKVASVTKGDAQQARYPVQATSGGGLMMQVQSVTQAANSTKLQVAVGFSNMRRPNGTNLAGRETYLKTASGKKLMLQRLQDNPQLTIANNGMLTGELTFQGEASASDYPLTLVINEGSDANATTAAGLTMQLPAPQ